MNNGTRLSEDQQPPVCRQVAQKYLFVHSPKVLLLHSIKKPCGCRPGTQAKRCCKRIVPIRRNLSGYAGLTNVKANEETMFNLLFLRPLNPTGRKFKINL